MSEIYNKNAREAHLMAEAYTNIYREEFNPRRDAPEHSERDPHPAQRAAESIIGAEVMWDGMMKSGRVDEVDVENGVAVVVDEDGGEHIVQLGDFDVVNPVEDAEDKDFDDEQRDQDPHRHKGLSDFDAEQRDQDPLRHSGDLKKLTYSVGSVGGQHGQIMHRGKTFDSLEDACNHAGVDVSECIAGEWDDMGDGTKEYGVDEDTVIVMHIDSEDNESRAERADVDRYEYEQGKKAAYDSEAHAYRDRADKYKAKDARDSIKVGNLYKGESYHELVIGIKGDEVYTDKGNRYDINQMLDELEYVDTIDFDFLNEIL